MHGTKQLELRKVLGTQNPADLMTKHLPRLSLDKCMRQLNQHHAQGRAKAGLDVQGMGAGRADPTTSPSAVVGEAPGPNNHQLEKPNAGKPGAKTSSSQKAPIGGQAGNPPKFLSGLYDWALPCLVLHPRGDKRTQLGV